MELASAMLSTNSRGQSPVVSSRELTAKVTMKSQSTREETTAKLFFYPVHGNLLLGSENPCLHPRPGELVQALTERFHIRCMITLTPQFEDFDITGLAQYHRPLTDAGVPSPDQVRPMVEIVTTHIERSQPVWCHCQRGLDRTGCVLGCSLTSLGHCPDTVIQKIVECFPPGRRTPELLRLWAPYADLIRSFYVRRDGVG